MRSKWEIRDGFTQLPGDLQVYLTEALTEQPMAFDQTQFIPEGANQMGRGCHRGLPLRCRCIKDDVTGGLCFGCAQHIDDDIRGEVATKPTWPGLESAQNLLPPMDGIVRRTWSR